MWINKHKRAAAKFVKRIIIKILKTIKMTQNEVNDERSFNCKLLSNVALGQNEKRCCIVCQNEDRNKY